MIRLLLCFALFATSVAYAQHSKPKADPAEPSALVEEKIVERQDAKEERDLTGWKWANFAILAGLLGWLIKKNAGPFFASRSKEIQKGISEAAKLKYDAEIRARAIEERLAGLQTEIESLRAEARQELHAEGERLKVETGQLLAKVQSQAEQDIAAAAKAARQNLKAHSVALAVQLAEAKLRARLNPAAQDTLVNGFVTDLHATRPGVN